MAVPDDPAQAFKQAGGVLTLNDAFTNFVAVTPSDTTQFAPTRGVYVANNGSLVVDGLNPNAVSVTFSGLLAGNVYPLRITRAYAAGTSSIGLVALY